MRIYIQVLSYFCFPDWLGSLVQDKAQEKKSSNISNRESRQDLLACLFNSSRLEKMTYLVDYSHILLSLHKQAKGYSGIPLSRTSTKIFA